MAIEMEQRPGIPQNKNQTKKTKARSHKSKRKKTRLIFFRACRGRKQKCRNTSIKKELKMLFATLLKMFTFILSNTGQIFQCVHGLKLRNKRKGLALLSHKEKKESKETLAKQGI